MLVDGPGELVIELPRDKGEYGSEDTHQDGQSNQHRLNLTPEVFLDEFVPVQSPDSIVDLVVLDPCVQQDTGVVQDHANDLNGVFHSQGIIH
jgi:hypothetical protein